MFLWFLSRGLSWLSPPRSLTKLSRFFSLYEDLRGIFIAPTQCEETWTFSLNNRWKGVFKSLAVACRHGSRAASHGCRSIFYVQERKSRIRRAGISRFVMACRHEPLCDGVKVKEETLKTRVSATMSPSRRSCKAPSEKRQSLSVDQLPAKCPSCALPQTYQLQFHVIVADTKQAGPWCARVNQCWQQL